MANNLEVREEDHITLNISFFQPKQHTEQLDDGTDSSNGDFLGTLIDPLLLIFIRILWGSCEGTQRIGHGLEASSLLSRHEIHLSIFSPGKLFHPHFLFAFLLTH